MDRPDDLRFKSPEPRIHPTAEVSPEARPIDHHIMSYSGSTPVGGVTAEAYEKHQRQYVAEQAGRTKNVSSSAPHQRSVRPTRGGQGPRAGRRGDKRFGYRQRSQPGAHCCNVFARQLIHDLRHAVRFSGMTKSGSPASELRNDVIAGQAQQAGDARLHARIRGAVTRYAGRQFTCWIAQFGQRAATLQ